MLEPPLAMFVRVGTAAPGSPANPWRSEARDRGGDGYLASVSHLRPRRVVVPAAKRAYANAGPGQRVEKGECPSWSHVGFGKLADPLLRDRRVRRRSP